MNDVHITTWPSLLVVQKAVHMHHLFLSEDSLRTFPANGFLRLLETNL